MKANELCHASGPDLEPKGKEKARPPKNAWHQDLGSETKKVGYTCGQLQRLAQDQDV